MRKKGLANVSTSSTTTPSRFGYASGLACRECGHTTELGAHHACAECFGPLEVIYDLPRLTRADIEAGPANIWRYASLLPVPADVAATPNTEPGWTRLVRADHLAREVGLRTLWVKDERGNPTHSFKDRVVAVALAAAVEMGFKVLACPSTGNLANAVAAAAARAGIRSVVLIPSNLEPQKIIASAVYGGTLVAVQGSYDDVNRLASELADEREDWAFVNVNVRPYYAEGSKTIGYEIAEQLGWRLPAQIVVPVASGAQLVKIDKAFGELIALGLVEDTPYRVFGAQGRGVQSGSRGVRGGARRGPAGTARHDRQIAGDRESRRRALCARRGPPHRRGSGGRGRRRGGFRDAATRHQRGHLRRDRGRRHPRRAAQPARLGPDRSRGGDRHHQFRRRPEDPGRRRGRGRPGGDPPVAGGIRGVRVVASRPHRTMRPAS